MKPLAKAELLRLSKSFQEARNAKRQRLVAHLHAAGPRPTLEALIAVDSGQGLDAVLEDFARVPIATYHALGASEFPPIIVVKGGRIS